VRPTQAAGQPLKPDNPVTGSSVTGRPWPETRPSPAGPPDTPATHAHDAHEVADTRRREAQETLGPDWLDFTESDEMAER
jgi:hypothetical protein